MSFLIFYMTLFLWLTAVKILDIPEFQFLGIFIVLFYQCFLVVKEKNTKWKSEKKDKYGKG